MDIDTAREKNVFLVGFGQVAGDLTKNVGLSQSVSSLDSEGLSHPAIRPSDRALSSNPD